MFNIFKRKDNDSNNRNDYLSYTNNNQQDIRFANLESKYENMKNKKEYFEREYKKLKGMTENLCKSIMSNEYNLNQLGGNSILKDMDVFKMIDFAMMDFQKQKIKQMETFKQLSDQIKMQGIMIESLKTQLTHAMVQNNKDISMEDLQNAEVIDNTEIMEPLNSVVEPIVAKVERDNRGNTFKSVNDANSAQQEIPQTQAKQQHSLQYNQGQSPLVNLGNSNNPLESNDIPARLTIENVNAYMSAMNDVMWDILESIGTEGFAKSTDITDFILDTLGKNYNKSNVLNSISTLKKMNILSSETISTGYRRFQLFKFTQKGLDMYRDYFKKEPVESEIDKMIRDHDNIIHGFTIKDTMELLLQYHDCTHATMERSEVQIKLADGKTYIPDVVATKNDGGKIYVEVELGNTPQKDFNEKCRKMLEVTKDLYFVTDVEEKMKKKLEGQISMFILSIGGKEKISGVTFYLTTMTQLSKGEFAKTMQY
ncbi:hypothetical protein [Alkaliphilus sp. B6464]|uniref:hypothetical protein n=1 Tax=Alkaliphilus sp. B6464 TaxID=2731219 RepID=UPI001BADEE6C|nr:hypothetical protein [Alkaliphilus sp. B6464]QUH22032.1 hypothetical protein HYG84_19190 [Alkaliphilus sp. B6464]